MRRESPAKRRTVAPPPRGCKGRGGAGQRAMRGARAGRPWGAGSPGERGAGRPRGAGGAGRPWGAGGAGRPWGAGGAGRPWGAGGAGRAGGGARGAPDGGAARTARPSVTELEYREARPARTRGRPRTATESRAECTLADREGGRTHNRRSMLVSTAGADPEGPLQTTHFRPWPHPGRAPRRPPGYRPRRMRAFDPALCAQMGIRGGSLSAASPPSNSSASAAACVPGERPPCGGSFSHASRLSPRRARHAPVSQLDRGPRTLGSAHGWPALPGPRADAGPRPRPIDGCDAVGAVDGGAPQLCAVAQRSARRVRPGLGAPGQPDADSGNRTRRPHDALHPPESVPPRPRPRPPCLAVLDAP